MARNNRYDAATERERNTVGRNIAQARHARSLSLAALSERLLSYGVKAAPPTISKWENGAYIPNVYQYFAIRSALGIDDILEMDGLSIPKPEPEPELNGEGLRKVAEYTADLIASGRYRPPRLVEEVRYVDMPVSVLPASAGTGAFLDDDNFEMVSFPESSIPPGAERGVRVSGDSMTPMYQDGQIVWMRRCDILRPGEVGIFLYDGCGDIKVYREQEPEEEVRDSFIGSDGILRKQPVLYSFNKRYEPIPVLPDKGFIIAGRVLN